MSPSKLLGGEGLPNQVRADTADGRWLTTSRLSIAQQRQLHVKISKCLSNSELPERTNVNTTPGSAVIAQWSGFSVIREY